MVEREGNRSSMRQMVPDGWALETAPAGRVQTAPSMLGPGKHPTSRIISFRGVNIEGAVRARYYLLPCRPGAPPRNHLSDTVRSLFLRDPSLVPPRSADTVGSRDPRALTPCAPHGRLLLRAKAKLLGPEEPYLVRIATHAWAPRGPETLWGLPR